MIKYLVRKIPKLLLIAVIVAFILRFWNLTSLPYPPDGDEVAFGYYGWSLLHFGTDEYGNKLPLNFHSIGDYKYPGLAYLNTIPAAIFGLTNLAVRFWGATLGVILVILVYNLTNILFSNKRVSTFAAWFVTLSPWAIIESRLGYENLISSVIVTSGMTLFLYTTVRMRVQNETKKKIFFAISLFLLTFASFTHAAPRFFIPAILLIIFIISFFKNSPFMNSRKIIFGFFISLSLLILLSLASPQNRGRAAEDAWRGITETESNRLQELYIGAGTSNIKIPPKFTWVMHNKYRIAVFDFFERYAEHFSFNFLFTKGEASLQRIPDMGVLLFVDILLLPLGLIALTKHKSKYLSCLIFFWLILSPIPSALAIGEARMNRATLMTIPLTIVSAMGANYFLELFGKNKQKITIYIAYIFLLLGIIVSFIYCLNQIFIQKPMDKPWYKQTVNEELTRSILELKDGYKAVATKGDDYIFFLFYDKISPSDFVKRSDIDPPEKSKWDRVGRFDNIYFKMPFDCPLAGKLNTLYVCQGENIPQNAKVVKAIYYPDGLPAYSLIEFYPQSQMMQIKDKIKIPERFHYMVDVDHKYPDGIIPDSSQSLW